MNYTTCLSCGERLVGRSDKKYCSSLCRSDYNNQLRKDENNLMRNVNNALRKNRRILNALLGDQIRVKVKRSTLFLKGYNLEFCTGFEPIKSNKLRYTIYEFQVEEKQPDQFIIYRSAAI